MFVEALEAPGRHLGREKPAIYLSMPRENAGPWRVDVPWLEMARGCSLACDVPWFEMVRGCSLARDVPWLEMARGSRCSLARDGAWLVMVPGPCPGKRKPRSMPPTSARMGKYKTKAKAKAKAKAMY